MGIKPYFESEYKTMRVRYKRAPLKCVRELSISAKAQRPPAVDRRFR